MSWWQTGPWKIQHLISGGDPRGDKLFRHHNPSCIHELTSYDVMHCEACAKFTETILESKSAEDASADADETSK